MRLELVESRRLLAALVASPDVADGAAGSLRAAIQIANQNGQHDTIDLEAGTYRIGIPGVGEDDNASGDFDIYEPGRDLTISGQGVGVTVVSAEQLDRVFDIFSTANVHLRNLSITGGFLSGSDEEFDGGGIRNFGDLRLTDVEIHGNRANSGGGLLNDGDATVTATRIRDNTSSANGGGIKSYEPLTLIDSVVRDNRAENRGGGIEADGSSLTIVDSTVSGNSVGSGRGGGVHNYGGSLTISGSTISGNSAQSGGGYAEEGGDSEQTNVTYSGNTATGLGGGIYNDGGQTDLINATITGNVAAEGGGVYNNGGAIRPGNTIIAGNSATAAGPDFLGRMNGLGFNLIGDSDSLRIHANDQGNNLLDLDPLLGALQDNGGKTLTHALSPDSPARDAGGYSGAPDVDQRGTGRPQGSAADIGSFELSDDDIVLPPPTVVSVRLNATETDPPDLPSGAQPTDWATQRSLIRSIRVTFSRPTNVAATDLVLTNLGVDPDNDPVAAIPVTEDHLSHEGEVLTISFADEELVDGVYQLEIQATATDAADRPLDGNGDGIGGDAYVLRGDGANGFYRLESDWNGDAGVSIFDFPIFAYWFGTAADSAPAYVNLDGDDGVGIFDFPLFAAAFSREVSFPEAFGSATQLLQVESAAESDAAESDVSDDETNDSADSSTRLAPSIVNVGDPWSTRTRRADRRFVRSGDENPVEEEAEGDGKEGIV